MRFFIKLAITIIVILSCWQISKRWPSLAGLIAVMPLTGAIVLVWIFDESTGDFEVMRRYTEGALWGILPSILFFLAAYFCFRKRLSLPVVLVISFGIWLLAAFVHQWFLHK